MRRTVLWTCWIPPSLWLAGSWYIGQFEGWGRWAAAPVLLPALLSSAAIGLVGLIQLIARRRKDRGMDWALGASTLLASSVIIFVSLRYALS